MWPFSRQQPPARSSPPPPERGEEQLELTARQQLDQLAADFAQLRLEWSDTLDRIQRWAGRMAARERQRIHRDLDQLDTAEDAPQAPNGTGAGVDPRHAAKAALRARLRAGGRGGG